MRGQTRIGRTESLSPLGDDFPAQRLTTDLTYADLIVPMAVYDELQHIQAWVKHRDQIKREFGLSKNLVPGYLSLFFGPPGTGKTLAVALLGKELGLNVYRVDLASVVSNWIGETETSLARVFDEGKRNHCLLFFDEADALFGERTVISSANDRYANPEINYVLQRMESYDGLIVLASNLKANIDDAFTRRFQSFVHFPMPSPDLRVRLWQIMTAPLTLVDVDLFVLAAKFELTGGAIAKVVRSAVLRAHVYGRKELTEGDIQEGVLRELRKKGRTI